MIHQLHRHRSRASDHQVSRSPERRGRGAAQPALLPEDAALYVCGCGNAFTAAVTTSVTCPACGDGQAW
jgi:hypothetical protein